MKKARDGGRITPENRMERRIIPRWISFWSICVFVVICAITPAAGVDMVQIIVTDDPDPAWVGEQIGYEIAYSTINQNVIVGSFVVGYDPELSFAGAYGQSFTPPPINNPALHQITLNDCGSAGSIQVFLNVNPTIQSPQVLTSTITAFSYQGTELGNTSIETTVIPFDADFSSNVTGGWVPFTVGFTDMTGGQLLDWIWEFGDGGGDVGNPNPVHVYDVPGVYDVTLTVVSNQENSDTEVKTGYITAAEPITADFQADVLAGPVPLTVVFTDLSGGEPYYWDWDFGDGGTSVAQNPFYIYDTAGTYTVSLTAGDDFGTDTAEKVSYITVEETPSYPVHNLNTKQDYSSIQAALDDASDYDTIEVDPGTYSENLYIIKHVTLKSNSGIPADTIIQAQDTTDDVIEITGSGVTVEGFTLTGASVYGTTQPAGVYLNDCSGCSLSNLIVNGNVHGILIEGSGGNYIGDATADGNINNGITIINSSENAVYGTSASGNWAGFFLFNAPYTGIYGGSATANSEMGFYVLSGSDEVTLEDCHAGGNTNEGVYLVQVSGCTIEGCTITNQPVGIILSGSSGNSVWNNYFDNGVNADDSGANFWNITPIAGSSVIGGDWLGGNYWADYTGADVTGDGLGDTDLPCTSSGGILSGGDWHPLTLATIPAPIAAFIANSTSGPAPLTVSFTDLSCGAPDDWSWDFGDGAISSDQNPVHTFINPGTYTVSLNVSNAAGSDIAIASDGITVTEGAEDHTLTVGPVGYEYTSIQDAVDAASPGDAVLVHSGTYQESVTIPIPNLTLRGVDSGGGVPVIESLGGGYAVTLSGGGTTLTGFSIFYTGRAVYVLSDDNTISSNTITSTPAEEYNYGIVVSGCNNNEISENSIVDNTWYAVWITGGSTHTLVSGNYINNNQRGVFVYGGSTDTAIVGNTLINHEWDGVCLWDATGTLVTENQIVGNLYGVVVWPDTPSNRIFFNNIGGNEVNARSNTTANAWESDGPLAYEWSGGTYSGVMGNYWSDYSGIDQNADGVGDIPYQIFYSDGTTPSGSDPAPLTEPWENYLVTGQASNPPEAAFTAFPVTGTAPLAVQFTDSSTQNPTAWLWDFGDGTNETTEAPYHQYTESGWYSPALTASNCWGSDTIVQQDSIRVYAAYYTIGFGMNGVSITGTGPGQLFSLDTTTPQIQYAIENTSVTVYGPPGGINGITYHLSSLSMGNGIISGPIASVDVRTQALMTNISGLGLIFPSVNLSLSSIPANAALEVGIIAGAGSGLLAGFDQAAGAEGLSAGSVAYCMDILPVNLAGVITNASVKMEVPKDFVDSYGAGNIRICRDHNGTCSVLETIIVEAYPSAVYFEGLSPDGFSTFGLVGMHVPYQEEEHHGRDDDYVKEPSGDDEIPEELVEPDDEEEITEENGEKPPSLSPPLEPVLPEPPQPGDGTLLDSLLATLDFETETVRTLLSQNNDVMSLCSMVQEGGARASGIDGGDGGKQVPAGGMLPAPILPIAAVTTSLAMSGAVVAAGFVAQRTGTSVVSSFLGSLFEELRRIADFVTSFIGEHFLEFIGEKEAGFIGIFAAGEAGAAGRLFSATEMAIIGFGAILYGVAFLIADRASYIPVLIVSYVVVTGVAVAGHEIAHHVVSRRYQVDSRVRIYYTGMVVSFLTAWLFGNVFAQPLMTHITDTEHLGKREQGIIMLAGPAVSVALALLFLLLVPLGGFWVLAGTVGFSANLLEAVYSLVPCTPMDGKHVCSWNRYVWVLLFVPAITIYLLIYVL